MESRFLTIKSLLCLYTLLSLVPSASAAPQDPSSESSRQSAWTRSCTETTHPDQHCVLYQTFTGENQNLLLVAEIITHQKTREHMMRVIVPLGILLLAPLQVTIDNERQAELPYVRCTSDGCVTSVTLPPEFINKLKKGKNMTFAYALPDQSFIEAPLSLQGITAGLEPLTP